MANMELLDEHSLAACGFYVSMPCSQKVCKNVQIQQRQHGTYLALIPLMNFNMGALTWNPFFLPNVGFRESTCNVDPRF